MLEYTKAESGHLRLENILVDPDGGGEGLPAPLRGAGGVQDARSAHRAVTEDFMLMLDRGKLRQILINLLSNAVSSQPDHGRIALSARLTPERACVIQHGG